ncbi:hypothetical protein PUNSTDRAFT_138838 [Punctularia strigosozonata HHB-11173 SS5]|uniref:non-specific serine/threonine protein kinase n=1 Tax=Punctularia strigosozonata (strain HHB-11173) TaxID=741275 RepID=R7S2T7_PUNST|nr:uncharacterized protein PUNSTDRAFT_138838 [Punctularia strigosozonata HHB-11173 SS5]EIN04107.1 hypothetical protein PUNSTDRAFT_138838 [Punctularia strigosozonata HHB-11173 SS5]
MSVLLTPPATSHRNVKENLRPAGSRVVWCSQNQYHNLALSPSKPLSYNPKTIPTRSILKKTQAVLPFEGESQREVTPEPSSPLDDAQYLARPVDAILQLDTSLQELIESYSVLAARLRSTIATASDTDRHCPLLQPIARATDAFVDALSRDLGRALVDPAPPAEDKGAPPSPKPSPNGKRVGMSAEQVKYARDLCTTTHAVIKLLAVVLTIPTLYELFNDAQLQQILTSILAIPLAPYLPTPNARKTHALVIWLLQTQRLPAHNLKPAADRIAYALRRGIEGELGREGKKGSASDGLKAIHDLSLHAPDVFVPAFAVLLPFMLNNLLASTLAMRSQATLALGGFAKAYASISPSYALQESLASHVVEILFRPSPAKSPSKFSSAATSPTKESQLVRTFRTTLQTPDPSHAAQGPVWALCSLSSLIVLLGARASRDERIGRLIKALLNVAMRHGRSSIRALACVAWRVISWSWFVERPQKPEKTDEDMDSDEEEDEDEEQAALKAEGERKARDAWWVLMRSIVDMGAGASVVVSLSNQHFVAGIDDEWTGVYGSKEHIRTENLAKALDVVNAMASKGGQTTGQAIDLLGQFVSPYAVANNAESSVPKEGYKTWAVHKLLPPSLFSSCPGLLTVEWRSLVTVVRNVLDECPSIEDARPLRKDELSRHIVFDSIIDSWRDAIAAGTGEVEFNPTTGLPEVVTAEVLVVWDGLVRANLGLLEEASDDYGTRALAHRCVDVIVDVLQTQLFNTTPPKKAGKVLPSTSSQSPATEPVVPGLDLAPLSVNAMRVKLASAMWAILAGAMPADACVGAGEKLLQWLDAYWSDSLPDAEIDCGVLCADLIVIMDVDILRGYWQHCSKRGWDDLSVRNAVWRGFVEKWVATSRSWTDSVELLVVPFASPETWEMQSADIDAWDQLLRHAIARAADYGVETVDVLEHVSRSLSTTHLPTSMACIRIADLLLSQLDIDEASNIPLNLMEYVDDALRAAYPPEPRSKVFALWLVRSIVAVVDKCPPAIAPRMVKALQESLAVWIQDEYETLEEEEYVFDLLPLYQTICVSAQTSSPDVTVLDSYSMVLESAFLGRASKQAAMAQSFQQFWRESFGLLEVSSSGWPARIQSCLDALKAGHAVSEKPVEPQLVISPEKEETMAEVEDVEKLLFPDSDDELDEAFSLVNRPASPLRPAIPTISRPSTPPSTPRASSTIFSTPTRPSKSSSSSVPSSCPSTSLSPRSPASPSPSRRRRPSDVANKENLALISMKPLFTSESGAVLGKRRELQEGAHDEEDVFGSKKVRTMAPPAEVPFRVGPPSHKRASAGTGLSTKRSYSLIAVELPTLKEVRRRTVSDAGRHKKNAPVALRRHRSLQTLNGLSDSAIATADDVLDMTPRKRRKTIEELTLDATAVDAGCLFGSDDSIMLYSESDSIPPSSDSSDDQAMLPPPISPAIRRLQMDCDPSSDDSDLSSSPSAQRAARRREHHAAGSSRAIQSLVFTKVFKVQLHPQPSEPVFLKYRFNKQYRHPTLDSSLTRSRVAGEARAIAKCLRAGVSVPGIRMVDATEGVIGLEWIDGQSVRKLLGGGAEDEIEEVEGSEGDSNDAAGPGPTDTDALQEYGVTTNSLMRMVGEEIGKMHVADIIHGDLTTSNMMLRHPSSVHPCPFVLIDFGLSYISSLVEDKAVDLYVLERAFASTHPDSSSMFEGVLNAYETCVGPKAWKIVKGRLDEGQARHPYRDSWRRIGGLELCIELGDNPQIREVNVYDATQELTEVGAGIALWRRPWLIMEAIGLGSELRRLQARPPTDKAELTFRFRKSADSGKSFTFHELFTNGGLQSFHRADFQGTLLSHLPELYKVHLRKRLVRYEVISSENTSPPYSHILLHFEDKTSATCDLLVGADGVKSTVRACMYAKNPALAEPIWSGWCAYRGPIPKAVMESELPKHPAREGPLIYFGRNKHMVAYPLRTSHGEIRAINVVAKQDVIEKFSNLGEESIERPSRWAIHTVNDLPSYTSSRKVLLIGDAAHAMNPHQGSGAGQGVEDGYLLAHLLAHPGAALPDVLRVYDSARRPTSQRVAAVSRMCRA